MSFILHALLSPAPFSDTISVYTRMRAPTLTTVSLFFTSEMNSPSAPHLAGHYVVNCKKEGDQHYSLDLRTLQLCHCKEYPATTFLALAPLILSDIEGVHKGLDVTHLNGKFYVFSPRTFGDLHNFLQERRQLQEGLAASIFRQIVLLVRDAHRKNVVLRDLKLKNFVFEDQEK